MNSACESLLNIVTIYLIGGLLLFSLVTMLVVIISVGERKKNGK